MPAGGERRAHARATDADGRAIRDGVDFAWTIDGEGFTIRGLGGRPAITASNELLPGASAEISVTARSGDRVVRGTARAVIVELRDHDRGGAGIPKPQLVDAPGASR